MNEPIFACGHVKPDTLAGALVAGKYTVTCELPRGHTGEHRRYGYHWPNDGSNENDLPPAAAPRELTAEELALIEEALDSHMYWQLSEPLQRNDGFVYYEEGDENFEALAECERLVEKIRRIKDRQVAVNPQLGADPTQ